MNLRELRLRRGLRAVDVAQRLGVAESSVRNWEHGRTLPNFFCVRPLCELYGVSLEQLEEAVRAAGGRRG